MGSSFKELCHEENHWACGYSYQNNKEILGLPADQRDQNSIFAGGGTMSF